MLRFLVGLAAVVVIAAGGVYLWKQYEAYWLAQTEAQQQRDNARFQNCQEAVANMRIYESGRTPPNAESLSVTKTVAELCLDQFPELK